MEEDTLLPFEFPSVARKKVSATFDGGMLSSDAGVLLLRNVEKQLGLAHRISACLKDKRDPDFIKHTVEEMLRLRHIAHSMSGSVSTPALSMTLRNGWSFPSRLHPQRVMLNEGNFLDESS